MSAEDLEVWVREHERWRGRVDGKLETIFESLLSLHAEIQELKQDVARRRKWPDVKRLAGFGAVVAGVVSGLVELIKNRT